MSFKRDGDDVDLLRSLKHRRVCELLSNHIPDDEALLLKNGRLTCLICSQRPIFDTLPMLAIHRKGKKHVNELSKYLLHKRESEMKKLKAEQTTFLRTGMVKEPTRHGALPPVPLASKLLVAHVSYNKRCRGLQRKATLDMHITQTTTEDICPQQRLQTEKSQDQDHNEETATRKQMAEHELKMRMSGWVKNANGEWVQDPDVEFDSDEEPPKFPD
ncbi:Sodium channel modifier 1 [Blattella germanica]|nr:Sodium channel modifier 1 [Blattella germanica]